MYMMLILTGNLGARSGDFEHLFGAFTFSSNLCIIPCLHGGLHEAPQIFIKSQALPALL